MRFLLLVGLLALATCTPRTSGADAASEPTPSGPALAEGRTSARDEEGALRLLEAARAAEAEGRLEEAAGLATRVVDSLPATRASVGALWLRGRLRAGFEPPDGARQDLERLLEALPLDDEREGPARLSLARVRVAEGDTLGGLRDALSLPPGTPADSADLAWARATARGLPVEDLESVLESNGGPGQPLSPTLLTAYARALRLAGSEEEARRYATTALEAGAVDFDRETAEALARGERLPRPAGSGPVRVGVVLPLGGSPAFQEFAREVQAGVEAAVDAWGLSEDVELLVLDDGGDVGAAANLVRSAQAQGAVAVVGLLDDAALQAGAEVRDEDLTLVSPTAYEAPEAGALSLNAFDPGAADALAEWAAGNGLRQVMVLHASRGASADEATHFAERFQELGGSVLRSLTYEPGATFFEEQLRTVKELLPEALVLPVGAEDVPAVAPQVTFFGLDTLGIRILGTGGWTDGQSLAETDPRHTDGVVVATPVRPPEESEGYVRFREAYENRFQRTLVSGVVPALGYDAASLVLQGIYAGAGAPADVAEAVSRVEDFAGASGIWSVEEGRLRRRHQVVCLEDRELHPLPEGRVPAQRYRPYAPDPETDEVPEGPGRPDGFLCPTPANLEAFPADSLWTLGAPGPDLPRDTIRF
jgi:ABC-type branched-subunit amino acid transport system substrate-binding protein